MSQREPTDAEILAAAQKACAKFYGTIRKAKDDTLVPDNEWCCFLFKDTAFAETLPIYRDKCVQLGSDPEQIAAIDRMISRMRAWRSVHADRIKKPDAKGEKLLG